MSHSVDYYFAVPSPWTYLAGPRFDKLTRKYNLEVNWKPYEVPRVFALTGTKPVLQRPPQIQKNRLNELRRWREYLDMPLNLQPKFFPADATPAAHMLISAIQTGGEISKLAYAYMKAYWAEEKDIADTATLIDIADKLGWNGKALFEKSVDGEAYDLEKYGQYFRPAGVSASQVNIPQAQQPAKVVESTPQAEASPVAVQKAVQPTAETTAPAQPTTDSAKRAEDILKLIRSRQAK